MITGGDIYERPFLFAKWKGEEDMSADEIKKRYEKQYGKTISTQTVYRELRRAYDEGIITVVRKRVGALVETDRQMESRLERTFEYLNSAIVVESDYDTRNHESISELHSLLGRALAEHLKIVWKHYPPSSIGISGGTGALYTARALGDLDIKLRTADHLRVSPLAGSMFSSVNLDPNDVGKILFGSLAASHYNDVPVPLGYAKKTEKRNVLRIRASHLTAKMWNSHTPDVLIIGIGSLHPDHRFRKLHGDDRFLGPIKDRIEDLVALANQIEDKLKYIPLGVVCNRLFVVDPPKASKRKGLTLLRQLREKTDELDECLIAVTKEQISMVKHVYAVAGGMMFKSRAIFQLLVGKHINNLCTDRRTASALLTYAGET